MEEERMMAHQPNRLKGVQKWAVDTNMGLGE